MGKENSAFNEKWIHIAEYYGKIMSAVSGRDIKYNDYFGARKGYLGLRLLCLDLVVKSWILRRLGLRIMHYWKFSVKYLR